MPVNQCRAGRKLPGASRRRGFIVLAAVIVGLSLSYPTGLHAASLRFSPPQIACHDLPAGGVDTVFFQIVNTGEDSLKILSIGVYSSSPYDTISFHAATALVAPGDSCQVAMRVATTVRMMRQDQIRVELLSGQVFFLPFILQSVGYLDCYPQTLNRSLHTLGTVITGTRLKDIWDADKKIIPDTGVLLSAPVACRDSLILRIELGPYTPNGYYWLLFEKDNVRLDSLLLEVVSSEPHFRSFPEDLHFGPHKSLDTLEVRIWDVWPGCQCYLPMDSLKILSYDLFGDTLAHLLVQLNRALSGDTTLLLQIVNPDSGLTQNWVHLRWEDDTPLPLEPEGGSSPGAQLPRAFSLGANYPNPFNPSTTISYSVAEGAPVRVRLRVYNLRGQAVSTLVDRMTAPGQYTVSWDGVGTGGEKLSSGVYFYRMTAGEFNFTRKMVLLK